MIRAYTGGQIEEMGFDTQSYQYPANPGQATGTLAMKRWGKNKSLVCYFDLDTGEKLMLTVWWKGNGKSYRPLEGDLDLSMVEIGSRMEIAYDFAGSGRTRLVSANLIS